MCDQIQDSMEPGGHREVATAQSPLEILLELKAREELNSPEHASSSKGVPFEIDEAQGTLYPTGFRGAFERFYIWLLSITVIKLFLYWSGISYPDEVQEPLLQAILFYHLKQLYGKEWRPALCQKCLIKKAGFSDCKFCHQGYCSDCAGPPGSCLQCISASGERIRVHEAFVNGIKAIPWKWNGFKLNILTETNLMFRKPEHVMILLNHRDSDMLELDSCTMIDFFRINGLFQHIDLVNLQAKWLRMLLKYTLEVRSVAGCYYCPAMKRVRMSGCDHHTFCSDCLQRNDGKCVECQADLYEEGFGPVYHHAIA